MYVRRLIEVGCGAALLSLLLATTAFAGSNANSDTRNDRYCEVIPSVTEGDTVTTYVYNTQGLNLCPAEQWDALTEDEVNAEYGSQSAKLNGPRYWMYDAVEALGATDTGPIFTFGGIEARLRATLVTAVGEPTVGDQFWVPNTVQRETIYTFDKGKPIYELIDPDGNVYVMQSYAQIYDPNLTIDQLPHLARGLQLPDGWTYRERTPRHSIDLTANGVAYVVNDNLANAYQQMNGPSLKLGKTPKGCAGRRFKLPVEVGGDTAVTRVRVGHRVIERTTSNEFTATIPVRRRFNSGATRRITVASRNDAGTVRTKQRFVVCRA